uniref:Seminal fluid protein 70A5 n=1 Tax=Drosophila yakuba TaxID=7245 RepID=C4NAQ6_DROYA|nr:seminal fluid protein 70A5 [Drosophila yakuba]
MKLQVLLVGLLGLLAVASALPAKGKKKNIEIWIRPKPMDIPQPEPY